MADSSWENPTIMGFVSRAIGIPDTLRIIGFPQERTDDRATFDAANAR